MSELMDTREEVAFDPEKVERVDPGKYGKYNYVRSEYYDRLLAANREQKAEIERLTNLVADLKAQLLLHMRRTVQANRGI